MKTIKYLIMLLLAITLFECSGKDENEEQEPVTPEPEVGAPVETLPKNRNYPSAFEGQTRIGGVKTTTTIQHSVITSALTAPWGITSLPDGRFLVTQKGGQLRIVTTAGVVSNPITGVPAVNSGGQGGLLGLRIDPQFATNRMVYWVFSEQGTGGNLAAVAKGRLSDNETTIENATVIFRATPADNSE